MLTCILEFHMASGRHFEMEMSSDGLKVFGLLFYDGLGGATVVTIADYQMGLMGAKSNLA